MGYLINAFSRIEFVPIDASFQIIHISMIIKPLKLTELKKFYQWYEH